MNDALALPALFVTGIILGWWFKRQMSPLVLKRVLMTALLMVAVPVALLMCASVLQSDTLGWIAGFSLMAILAVGFPLGLGFLLGAVLAGRSRDDGPSVTGHAAKVKAPRAVTKCLSDFLTQHPRLLIPMVGLVAAFGVVLMLGSGIDERTLAALVVILAVLVVVQAVGPKVASVRREARERSDAAAKRQAWLTAAAADPRRKRYAELIQAGDFYWTPARAEYELDPAATACCEHLVPIESAMRRAGLQVRLGSPGTVSADCCIDQESLVREFSLPEGVGYTEVYSRDRSGDDPPHALLFCPACESRLWVVHTGEARAGTPTFPSVK